MAETLTLKTNHQPSFFNRDMVLGALIGGPLLAFVPLPAAGLLIGGALGGWLGKRREENENLHGKKVGEPTFWNKKALIGGLLGWLGSSISAGLTFLAVTATTIVSVGGIDAMKNLAQNAVQTGVLPPQIAVPVIIGVGVAIAAGVGTIALGTYIGGHAGKKEMAKELNQAKEQQSVQQISQSVSPEVGQAVEYSLAHNKSWAQDILQDKLQSIGQQTTR